MKVSTVLWWSVWLRDTNLDKTKRRMQEDGMGGGAGRYETGRIRGQRTNLSVLLPTTVLRTFLNAACLIFKHFSLPFEILLWCLN